MAAAPHFARMRLAHEPPPAGQRRHDSRFCVFHAPARKPLDGQSAAAARGLVLHVHAFAEEMNKSRRMVAQQARALAANGYAVLQMDLLGCGDSAGDFGDATWDAWLDDVVWACDHVRQLSQPHADASVPLWLWGHRAGALLAAQAADRIAEATGEAPHLLLWQPSSAGKTVLQQFLRMKAAAELIGGGAKGVVESLRQELAAGRPVEVAGYCLHPGLASGLEAATLAPPRRPGRAVWLEVATSESPELLPASRVVMDRWRAAGWQVEAEALRGATFWQTTEIEDAPALIARSTEALAA